MSTKKIYKWLDLSSENKITPIKSNPLLEYDEDEIWNKNHEISSQINKSVVITNPKKPLKKPMKKHQIPMVAKSLPMNIPDWSKILGREYKDRTVENNEDDNDDDGGDNDGDDGGNGRLPPHEYLARTRGASFSVHEGFGRTLKGRDLSRVRNAIWKTTGFED